LAVEAFSSLPPMPETQSLIEKPSKQKKIIHCYHCGEACDSSIEADGYFFAATDAVLFTACSKKMDFVITTISVQLKALKSKANSIPISFHF
jgi:hypothetical protein